MGEARILLYHLAMALEMKPICDKCAKALPHDARAFICSFECTYCASCAGEMKLTCPTCAGELLLRPRRESKKK